MIHWRRSRLAGPVLLALALLGCARTAPQDYPALQPIDTLLAEADNAFPDAAP